MSGLQISRAEIEECQEIVNNFRVNELNLLLTSYHYPKLGKKQDLVQRAKSLLSNPKYQLSAVQKVREIQASNRVRQVVAPYSVPTPATITSQSSDLTMRRQQFLGNPNSINRSAMIHQSTNNMGAPFSASGSSAFPSTLFNQFPAGVGGSGGMANAQGAFSNFNYPHTAPASTGMARNLRTVTLPFYDLKSTCVALTELPAFNNQTRPGEARHQCHFGFAPEEIARLYYKGEEQPLPRYEVQFRMFQMDTSKEQEDAFPPGCVVKLDDYNVTLPNVIPTNKPNAEQKRLSRPVNLTPYCQPPRTRDRPHRLFIEWNGDRRSWAFGIFIVFRVNAQILQERILQNIAARRSFESTKSIIIKRLNGDDDDGIEMDTLKISLLCPLMRTRVKLPARAMECTHLQFFDLTNYLMMCEKRPVWKCPVCDNQALYSKLIIDQYFQKVISTTDSSVDDVELLRDGTWRVFTEEVMDLSDDDSEDVVVATTSKKKVPVPQQQTSHAETTVPKREVSSNKEQAQLPDCEIITLSDSDDDEGDDAVSAMMRLTATVEAATVGASATVNTDDNRRDDSDESRPSSNVSAAVVTSGNGGRATTTTADAGGDDASRAADQNESQTGTNRKQAKSKSSSSSSSEDSANEDQDQRQNEPKLSVQNQAPAPSINKTVDVDMDSSDSIICLDSDEEEDKNEAENPPDKSTDSKSEKVEESTGESERTTVAPRALKSIVGTTAPSSVAMVMQRKTSVGDVDNSSPSGGNNSSASAGDQSWRNSSASVTQNGKPPSAASSLQQEQRSAATATPATAATTQPNQQLPRQVTTSTASNVKSSSASPFVNNDNGDFTTNNIRNNFLHNASSSPSVQPNQYSDNNVANFNRMNSFHNNADNCHSNFRIDGGNSNQASNNENVAGNVSQSLSYNAAPVLQTNGFHPPVFRPVIDEVAKTHVAQELASFLQSVCAKNSMSTTN